MSTQLVPVYVRPDISDRLDKLALLAGSVSDAIERLITHWEARSLPNSDAPAPAASAVEYWKSPSGDSLPIGAQLEAPYKGKVFRAVIERGGIRFDDKLYGSPSAAARAVKRKTGLRGTSTSSDGRAFWRVRDPSTSKLVPISALNPTPVIDGREILARLARAGASRTT